MATTPPESDLATRLADEADLCRNEGATDIAHLLDEARVALVAQPDKARERLLLRVALVAQPDKARERLLLRVALAGILPRSIVNALRSQSGRGDFSSPSFAKLHAAGLIDHQLCWTDKGNALRAALYVDKP